MAWSYKPVLLNELLNACPVDHVIEELYHPLCHPSHFPCHMQMCCIIWQPVARVLASLLFTCISFRWIVTADMSQAHKIHLLGLPSTTNFRSGLWCLSATDMLLHICLKLHYDEHWNPLSYMTTPFEFSLNSVCKIIVFVNLFVTHSCM